MKKIKKLAKEAYNSKEVCQEWKDKILEAYPEVKIRQKGWYKASNNKKWLSYFDGERYLYGFNGEGIWDEYKKDYVFSKIEPTDYLATEEEVSEALIKEAKKREYSVGDRLKLNLNSVIYENVVSRSPNEYRLLKDYFFFNNQLFFYGVMVFKDGKWAEIIEQEPEEIKVTYEEVKPKVIELDGVKYRLTEIKN